MSVYPYTLSATEVPAAIRRMIAQATPLLLAGPTEVHATLRAQYEQSRLREVDFSGVGFFAQFDVGANVERIAPDRLIGGSVEFEVVGMSAGAGALLIVSEGKLDTLEVYSYDEGEFPLEPEFRVIESVPIEIAPPNADV